MLVITAAGERGWGSSKRKLISQCDIAGLRELQGQWYVQGLWNLVIFARRD